MANHTGSEGVVKISSATIAEMRSFDINEQADTVEDTVIGDVWKTRQLTQRSWDASMEVFWDETDTSGQGAVKIGDTPTLIFGPEGAATGDTIFTGAAIVTGVAIKTTHNGIIEASIKVEGNGALTISTSA